MKIQKAFQYILDFLNKPHDFGLIIRKHKKNIIVVFALFMVLAFCFGMYVDYRIGQNRDKYRKSINLKMSMRNQINIDIEDGKVIFYLSYYDKSDLSEESPYNISGFYLVDDKKEKQWSFSAEQGFDSGCRFDDYRKNISKIKYGIVPPCYKEGVKAKELVIGKTYTVNGKNKESKPTRFRLYKCKENNAAICIETNSKHIISRKAKLTDS